jgi:hypothetical protein
MKRRNFIVASGSTVFSSLVHSGFQRPVIGLDFEISDSAINSDPSTVNSFLINFDRLKITPQYLNDDQDITITVILKIEGEDISKKKATGVSFRNGETITSEKIYSRSGTDISSVLGDGFSTNKSFLTGDVEIIIEHQDISKKSYNESFTVTNSRIQSIGFESGDFTGWSGELSEWSIVSSPVYEGSFAARSTGDTDTAIFYEDFLTRQGDIISTRVYGDGNNKGSGLLFGVQDGSTTNDNFSGYAATRQGAGGNNSIGLYRYDNGSRNFLDGTSNSPRRISGHNI